MPLAIPPIACSRTPKRRLRPGSSALKFGSPLTSVRFDSDRSAAPPNSSGSGGASAWIASWLAFRVATSVAGLVALEAGVPAVGQPAAGHPAPELGGGFGMGVRGSGRRRPPSRDERLAGFGIARAEQRGGLVGHVERASGSQP